MPTQLPHVIARERRHDELTARAPRSLLEVEAEPGDWLETPERRRARLAELLEPPRPPMQPFDRLLRVGVLLSGVVLWVVIAIVIVEVSS